MKIITLILFTIISLSANDMAHKFTPSKECKSCHIEIYDEFSNSMHFKATPQKDPIHKAVWDRHPQNKKKNRYGCAKCHTPAADDLNAMMTPGSQGIVKADNPTHQEAISCAYCHRIESIVKHKKSNINIISKEEKKFFSASKEQKVSPFHEIETTNKNVQNGNICAGCHSHKMNKHKLNVCSTNIENEIDATNCVSCHMPKVDGHTFHGFAGSHYNSEMLEQYVNISILREINNFKVNIDNRSSHALLLHPLRLGVLKVSVTSKGKTKKFKNEVFVRVIGHNKKPTMPWSATTTLKDTMIKANEKRVVNYDFKLAKGDRVDVVLGWYLVNPKAVKKLGLQDEEIATKFIEFKKQSFSY